MNSMLTIESKLTLISDVKMMLQRHGILLVIP